MATVFRITARAGGSIGVADTMDGVVELAKDASPGHYRIEKLSLDKTTGEVRSWRCGEVTKDRKGVIKLHLSPWSE